MAKIVVATNLAYWNGTRGADQRILALLRYMVGEGHDVCVFFTGDLEKAHAETVVPVHSPTKFRAGLSRLSRMRYRVLGWIRWFSEGRSWRRGGGSRGTRYRTWYDFVSEIDRAAFTELLGRFSPDVVVVEYLWLTRLITRLPRAIRNQVRVVLDAHDVMHERTAAYLNHGRLVQHGATIADETAALEHFDRVLAIQSVDAAKFVGLVGDAKVLTVPHAPAVRRLDPIDAREGRMLFVGSASLPNVDGLRQFLELAWPRIRSACPQASLDVVGTVCGALRESRLPPGIRLHGQVAEVAPYYEEATIVVAPLTYGSGLNVKVVEAIGFGKPLVTTSIGAAGLDEGYEGAILIADGWEEFARVCIEMLNDRVKRLELGERALRYADRHLSPDAVFRELGRFITLAGKDVHPSRDSQPQLAASISTE